MEEKKVTILLLNALKFSKEDKNGVKKDTTRIDYIILNERLDNHSFKGYAVRSQYVAGHQLFEALTAQSFLVNATCLTGYEETRQTGVFRQVIREIETDNGSLSLV